MDDQRSAEVDAVVSGAVAELERAGLTSMQAAWALVLGGLNTMSDACDDEHLAELVDSVVQQADVSVDALH